ncbi:MAG: flagellar hook-length control protein FliK [Boseongicola sp.]|nr:flagellar hook-length control protein FliK [Boseongicola sp.]
MPVPDGGTNLADAASDSFGDGPDLTVAASVAPDDAPSREAMPGSRPPVARAAVAQIAEVLRGLPDGSVEVRLSPDELGRVKLTLVPGETGLVVQMMAERAETLDLLRRNADLLAADLRDAGYSGLEFAFGREDRGGDAQSPDGQIPTEIETEPPERPVTATMMGRRQVPTGLSAAGLDIRL